MPSRVEYWSDASFTSESSDSEEEEEPEEIYCPREVDYWTLEHFLTLRGPPEIISYVEKMNVVDLRECIILPNRTDIESVIANIDVYSWYDFWKGDPKPSITSSRAYFFYEDWDALGEFCFALCSKILEDVSMDKVRSCIIRILSHGRFRSPKKFFNNGTF